MSLAHFCIKLRDLGWLFCLLDNVEGNLAKKLKYD